MGNKHGLFSSWSEDDDFDQDISTITILCQEKFDKKLESAIWIIDELGLPVEDEMFKTLEVKAKTAKSKRAERKKAIEQNGVIRLDWSPGTEITVAVSDIHEAERGHSAQTDSGHHFGFEKNCP